MVWDGVFLLEISTSTMIVVRVAVPYTGTSEPVGLRLQVMLFVICALLPVAVPRPGVDFELSGLGMRALRPKGCSFKIWGVKHLLESAKFLWTGCRDSTLTISLQLSW